MKRFWRSNKYLVFLTVLLLFICGLISFSIVSENLLAKPGECPLGYRWSPQSGIDCIQINCPSVKDAHWGYTGRCTCGSAGSINENPKDPNTPCTLPNDHTACPGCVYACIHSSEQCPDNKSVIAAQNKCVDECRKLLGGGSDLSAILEASGSYPNCNCIVDVKDKDGQLMKTVKLENGDKKTTLTFDPKNGNLISNITVSLEEEREKIREKLGFKYTERQIDKLLSDEKIDAFFSNAMSDITTRTSILSAAFWWQHIWALFDHGFGNSADFVEIHKFGRCGDSMEWLERKLSEELKLGDKKHEAFVSITGEKYKNILNHTAILIRPQGVPNDEWEELMVKLRDKSRQENMSQGEFKNIAPDLMNAKVLDPYFKTETTVEEFIKKWSVIRIS